MMGPRRTGGAWSSGLRLAACVLASACYQPTIATGVPCSTTGECPTGQVCELGSGRCGPSGDATVIDAAIVDVLDAPTDTMLPAWSAAQPLTQLNSPSVETDPAISADGLELIFSSGRPGGAGLRDLYRSTRTTRNEAFGEPVRIAELSTAGNDGAAELTGDGLTIYLRRPGLVGGGADIFRATRAAPGQPFSTPVRDLELSSAEADTNPAISRDGLVASVTREPTAVDRELYLYTRPSTAASWSPARRLTELSTEGVDSGAAFDQTGLVVFFHSDRAGDADTSDLYVATRPDLGAAFGAVTPLAELNTEGNESDPTVTADLRVIVFERDGELVMATR